MNIAQLAIDTDPFVRWVKPVIAAVESRFRDESRRRTVVIQVTLHPDRPAEVAVAGQPAPSEDEVKDLLRSADAKTVAAIEGGRLHVPGRGPDQRRTSRPEVAPEAPAGDPRRAAVRRVPGGLDAGETRPDAAMGPLRGAADPRRLGLGCRCQVQGGPRPGQGDRQAGPQETRRRRGADRPQPQLLAGDAGDGPGDPLVAATRIALHAANGEIDQARRYSAVATFFDARKSVSSRLLGEFRAMMGFFYKDVESQDPGRGSR